MMIYMTWLMAMMRVIRLPAGIMEAIEALYTNNKAFHSTADGLKLLFVIVSGVLQGCPASAFLFNNAPWPNMFCNDLSIRRATYEARP